MNFLVVAEEYHPIENAVVNCLDKLICELTDRSHSVTVLTPDYKCNLPEDEEFQTWKIHRIRLPEQDIINAKLFKSRLGQRLPVPAQSFLGHYSVRYVNRIKAKCARKWLRSQHFDCILSLANPIYAHELSYCLTNKKLPWVMYNLDPYVFNQSGNYRFKLRMRTEKRWGRKATGVINTIGIQQENARHNYFPFKGLKYLEVTLPNLEFLERTFLPEAKKTDKCILRYTGMFYETLRRPDELLKILALLDPEKYVAEFYGPCCAYLQSHFKELPPCVQLMGSVSVKECQELVESADILINVGNLCNNQIPSKIFEYVSTGKPILNIYSTEAEISLEYLHRYPCIISTDSAKNVTVEMVDSLAKQERIPIETIREIYADCLRENVVTTIADFLENA